MKVKLKDFHENQYKSTWIALFLVVVTFVLNSFLNLYILIPSAGLEELRKVTNGIVSSTFVAYFLSIIFYLLLLNLIGIKPQSLIRMQNAKVSIIVGGALVVLFLLIQLPFISFDKMNNMSRGYLIGYLAELVIGAGVEELIFRAFLLTSLIYLFQAKGLGNNSVWLAVLFSSVLFSLAHFPYHFKNGDVNINFYIMAFLIGVLLSWTYIWFSNLILASLLHLLFNITMLYLPLENGGKALTILLWFVIMIILSLYGFKIKRYIKILCHRK